MTDGSEAEAVVRPDCLSGARGRGDSCWRAFRVGLLDADNQLLTTDMNDVNWADQAALPFQEVYHAWTDPQYIECLDVWSYNNGYGAWNIPGVLSEQTFVSATTAYNDVLAALNGQAGSYQACYNSATNQSAIDWLSRQEVLS